MLAGPMETIRREEEEIRMACVDPQRFTVLYDRYFGDMFRFILRRVGDRDLSGDLTQDTFLKAMLALPRYQFRGLPFRAWLYRIALNEVRMYWRKKKEVLLDLSYAEVRGLSEELGISQEDEEMARLGSAMGKLDKDKARLVELRFMDGLSYLDIGHILGIGEDAAKMRTHRMLALLRTYIAPKA
jgi:RNA polymerase sigma-70 factor, ECF subfamily